MVRTIYILGGGPAGLGAAYQLATQGEKVVVIEANNEVGGLARTVSLIPGVRHDLGPHKIFTTDTELMRLVKSFLPQDQWLIRKKIAKVYQSNVFLSYPPTPIELVKVLRGKIVIAGVQFIFAKFKKKPAKNASEYVKNKVGATLADEIILPAIEKVWGDPREIRPELAATRVQIPSLRDLLYKLSGKKQVTFEAHEFFYPKDGLSNLWKAVEEHCKALSVQFLLDSKVVGLSSRESKIYEINLGDGTKLPLGENDLVVSTLPVGLTCKMLDTSMELDKTQLDLMLVFFEIKGKFNSFSWSFIPDNTILAHRISAQSAFDDQMNGSNDVVCLEYMDRGQLPNSDAAIILKSKEELKRLSPSSEVLDSAVIRLRNSYPMFSEESEISNQAFLNQVAKIQNFVSIGRFGAGQYVGSLDAFDMGIKVSLWVNAPSVEKKDLYRTATSFYPVLD